MIRTQIQLPEGLYREAKRVAADKEWSLAEVVRRGLEYMTQVCPRVDRSEAEWKPPEPRDLGRILAPEADWRALAHERPLQDFDRPHRKNR